MDRFDNYARFQKPVRGTEQPEELSIYLAARLPGFQVWPAIWRRIFTLDVQFQPSFGFATTCQSSDVRWNPPPLKLGRQASAVGRGLTPSTRPRPAARRRVRLQLSAEQHAAQYRIEHLVWGTPAWCLAWPGHGKASSSVIMARVGPFPHVRLSLLVYKSGLAGRVHHTGVFGPAGYARPPLRGCSKRYWTRWREPSPGGKRTRRRAPSPNEARLSCHLLPRVSPCVPGRGRGCGVLPWDLIWGTGTQAGISCAGRRPPGTTTPSSWPAAAARPKRQRPRRPRPSRCHCAKHTGLVPRCLSLRLPSSDRGAVCLGLPAVDLGFAH